MPSRPRARCSSPAGVSCPLPGTTVSSCEGAVSGARAGILPSLGGDGGLRPGSPPCVVPASRSALAVDERLAVVAAVGGAVAVERVGLGAAVEAVVAAGGDVADGLVAVDGVRAVAAGDVVVAGDRGVGAVTEYAIAPC